MTEFVPPQTRGKWLGDMNVIMVSGLPVAALLGTLIIPHFGWRAMFALGGLGALVVWYLRKALPESPRWLESVGRIAEAEALLRSIENEVSHDRRRHYSRRDEHLDLRFRDWLPSFFVQEGLSIVTSVRYSLIMSLGAPFGSTIGAFTADSWGRKPTIVGASLLTIVLGGIYPFVHQPMALITVGFLLTVPIYILVATLFAIYIPELFPTEVRLRASGICNTFGRAATILTPFLAVALFRSYGIRGVLSLMIGFLLVQIVVVLRFGIEPKKRRLEDMV